MLKINWGEEEESPIVLKTPSISLNHALGGGFWTDRMSLIWGNEGSGKSTFIMHTAAMAQREHGFRLFTVDVEGTYTSEWEEKCGVDLSQRKRIRSRIVEDIAVELMPEMRKKDQKLIIVIDSVSGLMFENAMKTDDGGKQMANHAVPQKWLTGRLLTEITPNIALFYTAQQSTDINSYGAPLKANVGKNVRHESTNLIKFFSSSATANVERDPDTKRILTQKVTWTVEKSKQSGAEGISNDFYFNKETGEVESRKEILHLAKRLGIIEGAGAWFSYKGERYQGMAKLEASLSDVDWQTLEDTILGMSELPSEEE